MTNENTQQSTETKRPDYVAVQYRTITLEEGHKTRKEQIGALWKREDGSLMFRPAGAQIIDGDVYFFSVDTE